MLYFISGKRERRIGCLNFLLFICLNLSFSFVAIANKSHGDNDTLLIKKQLSKLTFSLHFPVTVNKFFAAKQYQWSWLKSDTTIGHIFKGMLLLDCLVQFGLNKRDYHPEFLGYNQLKKLIASNKAMDREEQMNFDIYFSDAIISLINHLHYGKYNPEKSAYLLDNEQENYALKNILLAITDADFIEKILQTQPQTKAYTHLQVHLKLLVAQYVGDCYEFPEETLKGIAINLERMRWLNPQSNYYININIPSFLLILHDDDEKQVFRVIVGKPENPTPTLLSKISYLTTAPDWHVPYQIFVKELLPKAIKQPKFLLVNHFMIYNAYGDNVPTNTARLKKIKENPSGYSMRQAAGCDNALGNLVFRFKNHFDVYLHDTPDKKLFNQTVRAYSHGCIRLDQPEKLAVLLLEKGSQSKDWIKAKKSISYGRKQDYYLKMPVPLQITYFTIALVDGDLISYPDIYGLDANLIQLMFP